MNVQNEMLNIQFCGPPLSGGQTKSVSQLIVKTDDSPLSSRTSSPVNCLISNGLSNDNSTIFCAVCGDRATGKHYGANSCDGCKGFFRRSVRKGHMYTCRFKKCCIIDKDKRNQCRYCRLKKCFRAGMKKEAVQNERDRIAIHKRITITPEDDNMTLSVKSLYESEMMVRSIGTQVTTTLPIKVADFNDIVESIKQQLLLLVEWAKSIKAFCDLSTDDKIALLKTHAGENLILGAARRSLRSNDSLLLGNGSLIQINPNDDSEINKVALNVLNLIVKPLKDIQINDYEFSCLKAIVFFDPDSRGISDPLKIKRIRSQIQINLDDYVNEERLYDSRGRFGEMLLILPSLRNLSQQMVEIVQYYKHYGSANIDCLLNEMLLGNIDISKNQHIENTSSTATATTNTNFATSSTGTSQLTGDFTNPFIHIIQDPYPPLNNSPILDSINGNGCFEDIYQASTINQTQTNSTTNANNFNRFDQFIKRFDEQEMLCKHEDSDQDGILFK